MLEKRIFNTINLPSNITTLDNLFIYELFSFTDLCSHDRDLEIFKYSLRYEPKKTCLAIFVLKYPTLLMWPRIS